MTRVLEFIIALVIVVVLFLAVGVFLPNRRHVEHSTETNHPVRQVYDTLNGFKRFKDWNPLGMHDPQIRYTLSGPATGVGAKLDYASDNVRIGSGSWEIVNSEQDSQIEYAITSPAYGENKTSVVSFEEKGKTVEITQEYDVEYGWSLPGRYAGLYVSRNVGDDIKLGLGNMVALFATMPNFDYKALGISTVAVQPQNVLYISTTSDRNITAVENAMDLALKDLRAAIAANPIEAAGPARLITTNFGAEKYEFDVAIPVRTPDPNAVPAVDPAAPADPNAPVDPMAAAPAPEPAVDPNAPVDLTVQPAPAPLTGLNLPPNVLTGTSYGGLALVADYQGHPAALPLVRDMLRSYAAAHGLGVHDRSFEEYLTDIADTAAEEAKFKVYWPIK